MLQACYLRVERSWHEMGWSILSLAFSFVFDFVGEEWDHVGVPFSCQIANWLLKLGHWHMRMCESIRLWKETIQFCLCILLGSSMPQCLYYYFLLLYCLKSQVSTVWPRIFIFQLSKWLIRRLTRVRKDIAR